MASAMRKMAVYLGLVEEGDEQYNDYDYAAPSDQYERAVVAQQPRQVQQYAAVIGEHVPFKAEPVALELPEALDLGALSASHARDAQR